MKAMRSFWGLARVSVVVGSVMFSETKVFAQVINSLIPTVTIRATDPLASWSGNTGTFTVYRSGNPTNTLNVFYNIKGTASNGVDYQTIGSFIQLPGGVMSNNIVIQPINLGQTNIKTVDLELGPSPLMTPGIPINYRIGVPSNAIVYITPPGVTDIPPVVNITSPTNGSSYTAPANIGLIAVASDLDGFVTKVEFFAGSNSIGVTTNWAVVDPPVVRITSPQDHEFFLGPLTLPIFAYAHDPDGTIAGVEFFDGTNDLGPGHAIRPIPIATPLASGAAAYSTPVSPGPIPIPPIPIFPPTNLFVFVWSNAPVGIHALTAVATDNGGASTISDPVNITILLRVPPPTNRPAIVSIVATEPVAIEGTNCWPWLGLGNLPTWSNWTAATPLWRVFTNWFPKDAVFTVRRWGDVSDDLTVAYGIGGTASNGVDYVTLPGVVTIPAGECSARITVVPLDDGPPDISSTVILTLTPDTNLPPDYVLGIPGKAAAIILDGPPWPATAVLPDKCFHFKATGPDGAWFHIECSPDTVNWTPICTNQVIGGSIDFVDPDAAGSNARFYRAVPELNPPVQ